MIQKNVLLLGGERLNNWCCTSVPIIINVVDDAGKCQLLCVRAKTVRWLALGSIDFDD